MSPAEPQYSLAFEACQRLLAVLSEIHSLLYLVKMQVLLALRALLRTQFVLLL
jgi:hypothetical protein